LDDIKSDLRQLRSDFVGLVKTLKDEAGERAASAASEVKERMGEKLSEAREYGEKVGKQLQTTIEEKPLASVLVAFGVGFLMGKLMDRR
jgi:ElaB/YqjD/DUF883 family membrane-anchored ribosome-binding protein